MPREEVLSLGLLLEPQQQQGTGFLLCLLQSARAKAKGENHLPHGDIKESKTLHGVIQCFLSREPEFPLHRVPWQAEEGPTAHSTSAPVAGHEPAEGTLCPSHSVQLLSCTRTVTTCKLHESKSNRSLSFALQCNCKGCFCMCLLQAPPSSTTSQLLHEQRDAFGTTRPCHSISWLVKRPVINMIE